MKRGIIVFILCLCHNLAFAQVEPKFKSGSMALLFNFAGLENLNANSFNGGIGGKYYLSPTMAVRGGIQFVTASEDIPNNSTNGRDGEVSGTTLGLSGALEIHGGSGRISPYFGGGAAFSTTSTEFKSPTFTDNATQTVIKNDEAGEAINGSFFRGETRFDFFALLGVEFFILNEVSLAAEYHLSFSNSSGKDEEFSQGTTTTKSETGSTSGLGISTAGFLTLSVYLN